MILIRFFLEMNCAMQMGYMINIVANDGCSETTKHCVINVYIFHCCWMCYLRDRFNCEIHVQQTLTL